MRAAACLASSGVNHIVGDAEIRTFLKHPEVSGDAGAERGWRLASSTGGNEPLGDCGFVRWQRGPRVRPLSRPPDDGRIPTKAPARPTPPATS